MSSVLVRFRVAVAATLLVGWTADHSFAQITPPTTVQLPQFGVAVDADGVLHVKTFHDPTGRLFSKRLAAAKSELAADVWTSTAMRKISLVKLERAVREKLAAGGEPDEVMRHLAGLQRVQYVFFYPGDRDIVIAGPAEGWITDLTGRVVGAGSGRPVLLLEDLAVALRTYAPARPKDQLIGCSIDPDAEGLARLSQFQQSVPTTIALSQRTTVTAQIAKGLVQSLGQANIRVFGVSERTHFARVLVEADYRMKLIGIGLEPPPVSMATFIGLLSRGQHQSLQRWWFVPNYDCVKTTDDHLAMELVGEGVQLLAEDRLIGPDGNLAVASTKPSKASQLFAASFTSKYAEIAARSPVYAQLRNMIDLLIAAAFIRHENFYGRADWALGVIGDEAALAVETFANPRHVDCAINVVWKADRLVAPAGGGVAIRPQEALQQDRLLRDSDGTLADRYRHTIQRTSEQWWWD